MRKDSTKIEFKLPENELLMVRDLLASLAQQLMGSEKNVVVKTPNPASTIVTYAYKELALEKENQAPSSQKIDDIKAEVVGQWGKIKVPDWLLDSNERKMLTISMEISRKAYKQMLAIIRDLYPTVFSDNRINKNDFIAATGIAYAHRISSGQVNVQITSTPAQN